MQSLKFCGITPWALAFEESPCHPLASEGELLFVFGVPLGEASITVKSRHLPEPHLSVGKTFFLGNRRTPSNKVIPGRGFFSQGFRLSMAQSFWGTGQLGFLEDDRGFFYAGAPPLTKNKAPPLEPNVKPPVCKGVVLRHPEGGDPAASPRARARQPERCRKRRPAAGALCGGRRAGVGVS